MDAPDALEAAALEFATQCLLQPESRVSAYHRVEVLPDGYNTGPESCADASSIDCDDLNNVLPLVAYWCRLNSVRFEITYIEKTYQCRFYEGDPLQQMVETSGSSHLGHELLAGAALLTKHMKRVERPNASMKRADFERR